MKVRFVVHLGRVSASLIAPLILAFASAAQSIPIDELSGPHRWDGAHGVVFLGNGLRLRESRPIRGYVDGSLRASPIDIFKDFPHLKKVVADDFAAGPNGSTLVAVVLNFGSVPHPELRHVILTYDVSGKLVSALDTEPYYFQAIATDDQGNIFALGNKLDQALGVGNPYPLLVVYDASGAIVREGLMSSVFRTGSRAVDQSEGADPSLMVQDGKVFIYAPQENEILVCLTDGTVVRRMRLDAVLSKIRQTERMSRLRLEGVSFSDENHVVLDVTGPSGPQTPHEIDLAKMHSAAYSLNLTTGKSALILRGERVGWNFLGAKANQLLMLSPVSGRNSMTSHDLPEN